MSEHQHDVGCDEYNALSRRAFVGAAAGVAVAATVPAWLPKVVLAKHYASNRDVIVSIFLRGGADGLAIVAPYADPAYYTSRPTIGIPRPDDTTKPAPERLAEMQQVVDRARRGDEAAVPRLRELLQEFPALGDYYGNAALHALGVWIRVAAGSDLHLRESLCVKVDSLRRELAGESPGPIRTLLVDRVVQSWLAANFFAGTEGTAIGAAEGPKMLAFRAKRRLQAERAHLAALALLAAVDRHLPRPSPAAAAGDAGWATPTPGAPADAAHRLADYFEQLSRRPATERAAAARN